MRETPPLYNLRRSGGRNPSSQDLKFIYLTRAMRGYRQHAISSKISCLEKKVKERNSDFSLRSTELGWSSPVGPRPKVGVLSEGYAWIPETPSFAKVSCRRFGESKASNSGSVRETSLGCCSCFNLMKFGLIFCSENDEK